MIVYEPPKVVSRIPIIDLGATSQTGEPVTDGIVAEIHRACRETGFFYVVNHGVPAKLVEDQLAFTKAFFDLPINEKLEIDLTHSSLMRGYERICAQTLDEGSPPDLKEGLMLGRELGPEHPFVKSGVPYEGANQWPRNLPGFREQMLDYLDAVMDLGRRLASLIALSLDLPSDYFAEALEEPSAGLRLLHYPPHPKTALYNQLGSGAHTDWGLITILLQDSCGGLEVKVASGDWIRADPVPGAFVVNLGDMVPRLTGGLYNSTSHRVFNNQSGRDRYSVPVFFNPFYHYRFDRAPTCQAPDEAVNLISFGEHVSQMYAKTYGKAG